MSKRRIKRRAIDNPDYAGYISATCLSCERREIGSAITFKRDKHNAILCKSCGSQCKVYKFDKLPIECPICKCLFESTNPSRKFCGYTRHGVDDYCRKVNTLLRKEATSIKNSKKRKRVIERIFKYLND